MNQLKNYFFLLLILILSNCGSSPEPQVNEKPEIREEKEIITEIQYVDHNPFYPLNDKIEDLEFKLNQLRAQVLEYESKLHAPSLNAELLKLIKSPQLEHEIYLKNGNLIQGKIIQENVNYLIVQTRIGQIKIENNLIQENGIREIKPLTPVLNIVPYSLEEKINKGNVTISGSIINEGTRRGDFVRIIYNFWGPDATDTSPSIVDSVFVSGNTIAYSNGVISSSCVNPGEKGSFSISVDIPDSLNISHWTKEIKSNIFE